MTTTMAQAPGVVKNWRVRMHDVIGRGVAAARQRKGWTQERAAREFRAHGLTSWRTSTVGSLEAGLRRPRIDEVLLMAAALGVSVIELIPSELEEVDLGDGAMMRPRAIRALLRDFDEYDDLPSDDTYFPWAAELLDMVERSKAERQRVEPLLEPIRKGAERRGINLTGADWRAAFGAPSDADRHATRRLGMPYPAQIRLAARVLWQKDLEEERDARVGDTGDLSPRGRQARRGLVTRAMLTEMRTFLDEECNAGGEPSSAMDGNA